MGNLKQNFSKMSFTFTVTTTTMTAGDITAVIFDDSTAFTTFVETFSTDAEKAVFTDYTDGYAITAVHTEATGANVSGVQGLIVTGTNGSQAFSSMAADSAGTVSSEW